MYHYFDVQLVVRVFFMVFSNVLRTGAMQFVRTVYKSIVDSVWDHAVKDGKVVAEDRETTQRRAMEVYRAHLQNLEQKKVDLEEFVYSCGLTSRPEEYKNQETPHVQAALQEMAAYERGELSTQPQAGNRIKFVPVLRSHMKKRKAAECVVSARLYDPDKHVLDRKKAADDLVNPLSQVCQAIGLNPEPMARACALKCRAEDQGLRTHGGGAASVKFEQCMLHSPEKRKMDQCVISFTSKKPRKIMSKRNLHKIKRPVKRKKGVLMNPMDKYFKKK